MRFYDQRHTSYCGVDLDTKRMYLCILDREGNKRLHRNVRAKPHEFLQACRKDTLCCAPTFCEDGPPAQDDAD